MPARSGSVWVHVAITAALAALTVAVYEQIAGHDFLRTDDIDAIVRNMDLRPASFSEAIHTAFTRPFIAGWTPLTMLSLQLDWLIYGPNPSGYHVTNLVLHALSTLLLYIALQRMTGATGASAFIAAVFAIHPLHVESVAWASERKDTLSGVFFMATLLAYAHYARRPVSAGRYALVLVSLGVGLLAKPSLVTLPCVLLLLDAWPLRRFDFEALREKLPMFGMVAVASYITLAAQSVSGAMHFGTSLTLSWRLANAVDAYTVYLMQTLWPTGLSGFYPHPLDTLSPLLVIAEALLLLVVTGLALAAWRRRPYLLVGWLWFLGVLVPMIGLVQVGEQSRADRYMYLPMIGLSIMLAFAVHDLAKRALARRVFAGLGVAAVAGLAIAASAQVATWQNTTTFFERILEVDPDAAQPHLLLGMHYADLGNHKLADTYFRRISEIDPEVAHGLPTKLTAIALGQAELGFLPKAIRTAEQAITYATLTEDVEVIRAAREALSRLLVESSVHQK